MSFCYLNGIKEPLADTRGLKASSQLCYTAHVKPPKRGAEHIFSPLAYKVHMNYGFTVRCEVKTSVLA